MQPATSSLRLHRVGGPPRNPGREVGLMFLRHAARAQGYPPSLLPNTAIHSIFGSSTVPISKPHPCIVHLLFLACALGARRLAYRAMRAPACACAQPPSSTDRAHVSFSHPARPRPCVTPCVTPSFTILHPPTPILHALRHSDPALRLSPARHLLLWFHSAGAKPSYGLIPGFSMVVSPAFQAYLIQAFQSEPT